MALLAIKEITTEESWRVFLEQTEIPSITAKKYAKSFVNNEITGKLLLQLIENIEFRELLGLKDIHYFKLLVAVQLEREREQCMQQAQTHSKNNSSLKLTPPTITVNCSVREHQLFLFNWNIYKQHLKLGPEEAVRALYFLCPKDIQNNVVSRMGGTVDQFNWEETTLLETIKDIVTTKLSPIVHVQNFHKLTQHENETLNQYLQRLQYQASCCNFACPHCKKDISEEHVKQKFILGMHDKKIKTQTLQKESSHPGTPLSVLLNEALVIEQSLIDIRHVEQNKETSQRHTEAVDEIFHMQKQNFNRP